MIINITRSKENLNIGVNITLKSHICVVLSSYEVELTKKYYNPPITEREIRALMITQNVTDKVSLMKPSDFKGIRLRNYEIIAYTSDGFTHMETLEAMENAIIKLVQAKINYLLSLDNWNSETVIEIATASFQESNNKGVPPSTEKKSSMEDNISIADLLNDINENK